MRKSHPEYETDALMNRSLLHSARLYFTAHSGSPTSWSALAALQADSLSVIPHLLHVQGDRVGVDGGPVPWRSFVAGVFRGKRRTEADPWRCASLADCVLEEPEGRPCHTQALANEAQNDTDRSLRMDDDALNEVFTEVHQAREAWGLRGDAKIEDLRVAILGGAWTKKNLGVSIDAYKGMGRTSEVDGPAA